MTVPCHRQHSLQDLARLSSNDRGEITSGLSLVLRITVHIPHTCLLGVISSSIRFGRADLERLVARKRRSDTYPTLIISPDPPSL